MAFKNVFFAAPLPSPLKKILEVEELKVEYDLYTFTAFDNVTKYLVNYKNDIFCIWGGGSCGQQKL